MLDLWAWVGSCLGLSASSLGGSEIWLPTPPAELANPSLSSIKLLAKIFPSGVVRPPAGHVGYWDTLGLCPGHQVSHLGGSLQPGLGVPSGGTLCFLSRDGL